MAARRLLIVMLVLLGISTLAAALVPTRERGEETTESTSIGAEATATVPDTLPPGEVKKAAIEVGGEKFPVLAGKDPVRVGDQLSLAVRCRCEDLLEIPALGIVEPVTRKLPARLQILARSAGHYGIRLVRADRLVARIEIAPAKKRTEEKSDGEESGG